jgi:hypothetical protein
MGEVADRVSHTDVPNPEQAMTTAMAIHCEAAGMLGSRLGLGERVTAALERTLRSVGLVAVAAAICGAGGLGSLGTAVRPVEQLKQQ